jgi:guanylate cyclase
MYGLILENVCQYIKKTYGSQKWDEVRKLAEINDSTFSTHSIYPDYYMINIINKSCQVCLFFKYNLVSY